MRFTHPDPRGSANGCSRFDDGLTNAALLEQHWTVAGPAEEAAGR
jgi:hypothetical protein